MKSCLLTLLLVMGLAACGGSQEGSTPSVQQPMFKGELTTEQVNLVLAKGAEINALELQAEQRARVAGKQQVPKSTAKAGARVTVHRFYNTLTAAHFYTSSESEKAHVQANLRQFSYEGPAFYASAAGGDGLSSVFRFLNTQTGVHFYTISAEEKAFIELNLKQFNYEGIAYHASKTSGVGLKALYRFYVAAKGFHFYTANASERDVVIATNKNYSYEGPAYYVYGAAEAPEVPVPTGTIPHTGATVNQCFQAGFPLPPFVSCSSAEAVAHSGAGKQDGMLTSVNPMSYRTVGSYSREECIKDNVTGLIWEGKTASGPRAGSNVNHTNRGDSSVGDASAYVNAVNDASLCGANDWRLPTAGELQTLVDYGRPHPGPTIDTTWFTHTVSASYWSSSGNVGGTDGAWTVNFQTGGVGIDVRGFGHAVRLVRSSP